MVAVWWRSGRWPQPWERKTCKASSISSNNVWRLTKIFDLYYEFLSSIPTSKTFCVPGDLLALSMSWTTTVLIYWNLSFNISSFVVYFVYSWINFTFSCPILDRGVGADVRGSSDWRALYLGGEFVDFSVSCASQPINKVDSVLYSPIQTIHQLLPPINKIYTPYLLRPRAHSHKLPDACNRLMKNVICQMLYKNIYFLFEQTSINFNWTFPVHFISFCSFIILCLFL